MGDSEREIKSVANSTNQQAFFALLRSGLWEKEARLSTFGVISFERVQRLAEEQSVLGLVVAGLDHVVDIKIPKKDVLPIIGQTLQLEQKNQAMNLFIGALVEKMRKVDIYAILVKGQGIAQCYERPLWRSSGDVDFFLSDDNYKKAKQYLIPLAAHVDEEGVSSMHLGMTIDSWVVELHGTMHTGLASRIDKVLDRIKEDVFNRGDVRSWMNDTTQVFLPGVNSDALLVFTHFLKHFYKGGLGLRQICDWCRLLWTYRDSIDRSRLESNLISMGLVSEWKAFGAFAVDYLGMPSEAMPLYDSSAKWHRKADKICRFVMDVGNFGHNRDMSYYGKRPYFVRKVISFGQRMGDLFRHAGIFPLDSLRFFPKILFNGLRSAARGE